MDKKKQLVESLNKLCEKIKEVEGVDDAWLDLDCFNCGEPGIGIQVGISDEFMEKYVYPEASDED